MRTTTRRAHLRLGRPVRKHSMRYRMRDRYGHFVHGRKPRRIARNGPRAYARSNVTVHMSPREERVVERAFERQVAAARELPAFVKDVGMEALRERTAIKAAERASERAVLAEKQAAKALTEERVKLAELARPAPNIGIKDVQSILNAIPKGPLTKELTTEERLKNIPSITGTKYTTLYRGPLKGATEQAKHDLAKLADHLDSAVSEQQAGMLRRGGKALHVEVAREMAAQNISERINRKKEA